MAFYQAGLAGEGLILIGRPDKNEISPQFPPYEATYPPDLLMLLAIGTAELTGVPINV
jgi:hypothetical protein